QAILTIGNSIAKGESKDRDKLNIIELDFKYFYTLICEYKLLRTVFILKEKSSERLKRQMRMLTRMLSKDLQEDLAKFKGDRRNIKNQVDPILNDFIEFQYKGPFTLNKDLGIFLKTKKEHGFTSRETSIIDELRSYSQKTDSFELGTIPNLFSSEENKDLIILAIESLIEKKIIIPISK
ncbi:unnamed protein product, partial [marine sediment metagenome]